MKTSSVKSLDIPKMHEDSDSYKKLKDKFAKETRCEVLCDFGTRFVNMEYSPLCLTDFSNLMSRYDISWRNPEDYRSYLREVLRKEIASEYDLRSQEMLALHDEMNRMTDLDAKSIHMKEYQKIHNLAYLKLMQMHGLLSWVFGEHEEYFK